MIIQPQSGFICGWFRVWGTLLLFSPKLRKDKCGLGDKNVEITQICSKIFLASPRLYNLEIQNEPSKSFKGYFTDMKGNKKFRQKFRNFCSVNR